MPTDNSSSPPSGQSAQNFLVTGHGRSGTLFLAKALNLSPTWTVTHERVKNGTQLRGLARSERKGDVSHYARRLRSVIKEPLGKVMVIYRDPLEVATSLFTKGTWMKWKGQWALDYQRLDTILQWCPKIRFDRMTTDPHYLAVVAEGLGITDLPVEKVDFSRRVNAFPGETKALPPSEVAFVERETAWFREKHG